jgi:phosphatidylglycerophosphatase A
VKTFYYIFATGFGAGYSPIAPGTAGSILATAIAFFVFEGNTLYISAAAIIWFGAGTISASFIERERQTKDPQFIVVDEMVGMWVSLILVPLSWWAYLIAFVFFRFFDIVKPFPVNATQNLHGGMGVMLDDIVAGIYAFICVHLVLLFI